MVCDIAKCRHHNADLLFLHLLVCSMWRCNRQGFLEGCGDAVNKGPSADMDAAKGTRKTTYEDQYDYRRPSSLASTTMKGELRPWQDLQAQAQLSLQSSTLQVSSETAIAPRPGELCCSYSNSVHIRLPSV